MARKIPINISAFEPDQQRAIEDLYDIVSGLTSDEVIQRKVVSTISSTSGSSGGSTTDHGGLTGLDDDDHPQYLPVSGSRSMTGSLNLGGNSIINVSPIAIQYGGTGAATASDARSNLGVKIGEDVQGWDNELQILSTLSTANANAIVGITGTQWGYLGVLNQSVRTDADVGFNNISGADGNFSGVASALTLATLSGTLMSGASFRFRNQTDTAFRDAQMAAITATSGLFSNGITVSGGDVKTNNFVSQASGWRGTYAGAWDMRSLYSDEIRTKAFISEISEALVGAQFIGKSRARVSRDLVIPINGNTTQLYVEDLEGFPNTPVFSSNDWVLLRIVDKSGGGLVAADVWGMVTSYTDLAGGEQRWTFTTQDDGGASGDTIYGGSLAIDFGQSGDGIIRSTVLDSQGSPYIQIETWTTDPSNGGNYTTLGRFGDLGGIPSTSGAGLYTSNAFLTGTLVAGNLSKTDNYMQYQNGVLTVNGVFVVRGNSSGIGNFTDAGTLAKLNSVSNQHISDGAVEKAKLGNTIISGGLIVADLLSASRIQSGSLVSQNNNLVFNLDTGLLSADVFTLIAGGDDIGIDSANKRIYFNTPTYGQLGIQMEYNGGSPRVHIGSTTRYLRFTGSNVNISTGNAYMGNSSGWFGGSNILTYNTNQVGLAGLIATSGTLYSSGNGNSFGGPGIYIDSANERISVGSSVKMYDGKIFAEQGVTGKSVTLSNNQWVEIGDTNQATFVLISAGLSGYAFIHLPQPGSSGSPPAYIISSNSNTSWNADTTAYYNGHPIGAISGRYNVMIDRATGKIYIYNRIGFSTTFTYQYFK